MNPNHGSVFAPLAARLLLATLLAGGPALADAPATATPPPDPGAAAPSPDATDAAASDATETDAQPKLATLRITVTRADDTAAPIDDAKVLLTYADGTERQGKADAAGTVALSELPYGAVDLDITATGMQSAATVIDLDRPLVEAAFTLKPRPIPKPVTD